MIEFSIVAPWKAVRIDPSSDRYHALFAGREERTIEDLSFMFSELGGFLSTQGEYYASLAEAAFYRIIAFAPFDKVTILVTRNHDTLVVGVITRSTGVMHTYCITNILSGESQTIPRGSRFIIKDTHIDGLAFLFEDSMAVHTMGQL